MKAKTAMLLAFVLAGVTINSLSMPAARAADQMVIAAWGGAYQDLQRKVMFKPYQDMTGTKVIEATIPLASKIRAMVESGNVEWDVAQVVPPDYYLLVKLGMLEKIDYSKFDKETLAAYDPTALLPYGVGTLTYSRVIAWSTEAFPAGKPHPESFADVWDFKKFPGKRVLDAGDYVGPLIEYSLLASGVQPGNLYPLDFDRAYANLTQIRPAVVKWANNPVIGVQALVDGEASIAVVPYPRLLDLKEKGAPVDFTFNEGLLKRDFLVIPKGAKNVEAAMKYIAFASQAKQQAGVSAGMPYGPSNNDAFKYIDAARAPSLPTYPANLKKQIYINDQWWAETDPKSGKSWLEDNAVLWNQWAAQK